MDCFKRLIVLAGVFCFVTVRVVDKKRELCPTATNKIHFKVKNEKPAIRYGDIPSDPSNYMVNPSSYQ